MRPPLGRELHPALVQKQFMLRFQINAQVHYRNWILFLHIRFKLNVRNWICVKLKNIVIQNRKWNAIALKVPGFPAPETTHIKPLPVCRRNNLLKINILCGGILTSTRGRLSLKGLRTGIPSILCFSGALAFRLSRTRRPKPPCEDVCHLLRHSPMKFTDPIHVDRQSW